MDGRGFGGEGASGEPRCIADGATCVSRGETEQRLGERPSLIVIQDCARTAMALPTRGRVIIDTTAGEIDIELWSKVRLQKNILVLPEAHTR